MYKTFKKETMELKKQTRDNEREKAIKNDAFETYKFKEPLYVKDIVKVYGYVGRIISISEYPRSDTSEEVEHPTIPSRLNEMTVYLVYTFHNMQSEWCKRAGLFRLIPETDDDELAAYSDDYGDKTYDEDGAYHGYEESFHGRDGEWVHGEFYEDSW